MARKRRLAIALGIGGAAVVAALAWWLQLPAKDLREASAAGTGAPREASPGAAAPSPPDAKPADEFPAAVRAPVGKEPAASPASNLTAIAPGGFGAASPPGGGGGVNLRVRRKDGSLVRGFRVSACENPHANTPTAWQPAGFGWSGGSSIEAATSTDTCHVRWFGSPRISLLVVVPGEPTLVAEAVACAAPGNPAASHELALEDAPSGTLEVTVLDADGGHWTEGFVRCIPEHGHPIWPMKTWYRGAAREVRASADGVYRLERLVPSDSSRVEVCFREQVLTFETGVEVRAGATATRKIQLPGLRRVTVGVTYRNRGVPRLTMRLQPEPAIIPPGSREAAPQRATTNAQGLVELLLPQEVQRVTLSFEHVDGLPRPTSSWSRALQAGSIVGTLHEEAAALVAALLGARSFDLAPATQRNVFLSLEDLFEAMKGNGRDARAELLRQAQAKDPVAAKLPATLRSAITKGDLPAVFDWLLAHPVFEPR